MFIQLQISVFPNTFVVRWKLLMTLKRSVEFISYVSYDSSEDFIWVRSCPYGVTPATQILNTWPNVNFVCLFELPDWFLVKGIFTITSPRLVFLNKKKICKGRCEEAQLLAKSFWITLLKQAKLFRYLW